MVTFKELFRFVVMTLLCCSVLPENLNAQSVKEIRVVFRPVYFNEPFIPVKKYSADSRGGSIRMNTLRFYISNVRLQQKKVTVWQEGNSHHLIDFNNTKSFNVLLNDVPDVLYDEIVFDLGIDSITNVSGAMGGDLDPTNGMYWTWQSGYVNMKIMGAYSDDVLQNKDFQFHIGGYQFPYNSLQTVSIDVSPARVINIDADFSKLLHELNYNEVKEIMQPCDEATKFAKSAALIFRSRSR